MKRIAVTTMLLGLLVVGSAHAQVATTDFVPAAPFFVHPQTTGINGANITPDNPAAVAWGTPSRVALGALQGSEEIKSTPGVTFDYDGKFGGLRLVGDRFGVALETSSVDLKNPPPGVSSVSIDKSNDVQLSMSLGDWLGVGVGAGKTKSEASGDDISRKELGVSLRINEVFYIGAAAYQDENTPIGVVPSVSEKRNGTLYGIALRTEGNVSWYVAYDSISLDSFDFSSYGGPVTGGFDLSRFSVQALVGWFLIGATASDLTVKDPGGGNPDVKHKAIDIGYAPMQGLTVSARVQKVDVTNGNPDETITTKSLAVGWQF